jgi:hypothetical protein
MIPKETFIKIVRSASRAPSGHNTQPWKFSFNGDSLTITPDFDLSLAVADPDHRELWISLGCAAETAMIAARYYGYKAETEIVNNNGSVRLRIDLRAADTEGDKELFPFIASRQTTRNLYKERSVPAEDLKILETAANKAGIRVTLYTGRDEISSFKPFIAEAVKHQFGNPDYKNELICWMRFSEKEAMKKGDGLYTACNGIPSMGRLAGSFVVKLAVNAASEEKRLLRQVDNTAVVAMFTSGSDDPEDLVNLGISFQRFALTATKLNICHSHINTPCQVPPVREKMIGELGITNGLPQLLIRLGYSDNMAFSFRRSIDRQLLQESRGDRTIRF